MLRDRDVAAAWNGPWERRVERQVQQRGIARTDGHDEPPRDQMKRHDAVRGGFARPHVGRVERTERHLEPIARGREELYVAALVVLRPRAEERAPSTATVVGRRPRTASTRRT